jgi:hypothetical protein
MPLGLPAVASGKVASEDKRQRQSEQPFAVDAVAVAALEAAILIAQDLLESAIWCNPVEPL